MYFKDRNWIFKTVNCISCSLVCKIVFCSEFPDISENAGKVTGRRRRRTWEIAKRYAFHANAIIIKYVKFSYSLIESQLLPCVPACGCKFHALAVFLDPIFTAPFQSAVHLESSQTSAAKLLFAADYFCRWAPSWMFDRILNGTLSNNLLQLAQGLRWSFHHWGFARESWTHRAS